MVAVTVVVISIITGSKCGESLCTSMPHSPSRSCPALLKQMCSVPVGAQDVKGNHSARVRLLRGALLLTEELTSHVTVLYRREHTHGRACTHACARTHMSYQGPSHARGSSGTSLMDKDETQITTERAKSNQDFRKYLTNRGIKH